MKTFYFETHSSCFLKQNGFLLSSQMPLRSSINVLKEKRFVLLNNQEKIDKRQDEYCNIKILQRCQLKGNDVLKWAPKR